MEKNIKGLEEILTDKMAGLYNYKLNETFYQIYKSEQYWIVYETTEIITGLWNVVIHTDTLKEAKLDLVNYINSRNDDNIDIDLDGRQGETNV